MNNNYKIRRKLLSPPGDTLQETIDTYGMNQYELAERLGKNIKNVNRIIKGKETISTETALSLEKVLGIPANFWLERERIYRKELAELEMEEQLETHKDWIKDFPVSAMEKLNWLPKSNTINDKISSLLTFFGIASPARWGKIYENTAAVSFRISLKNTSNSYSISAWLRQGEIQAKNLKLKQYDKAKFRKSLSQIRRISYNQPADYLNHLREICSENGVALVYTPNVPHAAISGASRWISDLSIPLIQLSGRYKTNDHFWFTFFHEAGHILLHGKKDIFLEKVEGVNINKTKEKEADKFAQNQLINEKAISEFIKAGIFSKQSIVEFAKKNFVYPGIVVGMLQHYKYISHSDFNDLKVKIILSE